MLRLENLEGRGSIGVEGDKVEGVLKEVRWNSTIQTTDNDPNGCNNPGSVITTDVHTNESADESGDYHSDSYEGDSPVSRVRLHSSCSVDSQVRSE